MKQDIHNSEWDVLIILDACRYDTFKQVIPDYFEGKLKKVISPASNTSEWLVKTFPHTYDYVYVSGNPFINNQGISTGELINNKSKEYDWTAKEHFTQVCNSWEKAWSKHFQTVMPSLLARETEPHLDQKPIIHFMQPHTPFICYSGMKLNEEKNQWIKMGNQKKVSKKTIKDDHWLRGMETLARKHLPFKLFFGMRELMGFKNYYGHILLEEGMEGVRKKYESNLCLALEAIKTIDTNKKIVLTADHGECLGEHSFFGHGCNLPYKELHEIPWFEKEVRK